MVGPALQEDADALCIRVAQHIRQRFLRDSIKCGFEFRGNRCVSTPWL